MLKIKATSENFDILSASYNIWAFLTKITPTPSKKEKRLASMT